MIYAEVEKKELDEVQRVFAEHLRQCPDYELLWSDSLYFLPFTSTSKNNGSEATYSSRDARSVFRRCLR